MERMSFIGQSYYRGANAALLCYSINKKETFSILSQYILDIVMNAEGAKIFLCGNFSDNEEGEDDCVNETDIENFTRDCGNVLSGNYRVSCKDNTGVQEMFTDMAKVLHQDSVSRMTLQRDFVIKPGETTEEEPLHKRKCCTSWSTVKIWTVKIMSELPNFSNVEKGSNQFCKGRQFFCLFPHENMFWVLIGRILERNH